MKKLLKVLAAIFIVFLGLVGIGVYFLSNLFSGMCANEIFSEVQSPDGKFRAVIFQRDCGATTGFSTQISLILAKDKLENEGGNIFIVDGHPNDRKIGITWQGPKKLIIKNGSGLQSHKKESRYQGVSIDYE